MPSWGDVLRISAAIDEISLSVGAWWAIEGVDMKSDYQNKAKASQSKFWLYFQSTTRRHWLKAKRVESCQFWKVSAIQNLQPVSAICTQKFEHLFHRVTTTNFLTNHLHQCHAQAKQGTVDGRFRPRIHCFLRRWSRSLLQLQKVIILKTLPSKIQIQRSETTCRWSLCMGRRVPTDLGFGSGGCWREFNWRCSRSRSEWET